MLGWLIAGLCSVLAAQTVAQECGREVLSYNFDDHPGPFAAWTEADLGETWPQGTPRPDFRGDLQTPGIISTKGIERASVGEGQLRLFMPKGCVGTDQCGMVFTVRLDEEYEEATLSYRFKFSDEYTTEAWTMGGKLPGLSDEDMATGCRSSDVSGTGSFVARTMWREQGQLVSYMYITPSKRECVNGEDWRYNKFAEGGKWYTMFMHVKLNTPGARNGLHNVWIQDDGGEPQLVYSKQDVYYRSLPGHGIAKLKFDSFHGGSDSRFSPTEDRYIYFDDLKITEGNCVAGAVVGEFADFEDDTQPDTGTVVKEKDYEVDDNEGEDEEVEAYDYAEVLSTDPRDPPCTSEADISPCTEVAQPAADADAKVQIAICTFGAELCAGSDPAVRETTDHDDERDPADPDARTSGPTLTRAYMPASDDDEEVAPDEAMIASSSMKNVAVSGSAVLAALILL